MASVRARGEVLYAKIKGLKQPGVWDAKATKYKVGQEALALRYANEVERIIAEKARAESGEVPASARTVDWYLDRWKAAREKRGVQYARGEWGQLRKHICSRDVEGQRFGDLLLANVRPRHFAAIFTDICADAEIAPRTVLNLKRAAHAMFESAVIEELIASNPVIFQPGLLPRKVDKDPTWRSLATYATSEIEQLLFGCALHPDAEPLAERLIRAMRYALKSLGCLRHGEVAGLGIAQIDFEAKPLMGITVARSWSSRAKTLKGTKTQFSFRMPVHPVLGCLIREWLKLWPVLYGREPLRTDLLVPNLDLSVADYERDRLALKQDLVRLGLRVEAGAYRDRGGHDMRSWFLSQAIEDGADGIIIDACVHMMKGDVASGYRRFSWSKRCAEVSKLVFRMPPDEDPFCLGPALGTLAVSARSVRENSPVGLGKEPKGNAPRTRATRAPSD